MIIELIKYNNVKRIIISAVIICSLICCICNPLTSHAAIKHPYWIKVNMKTHVCLAYQKINGKWEPIRAMYCSGGISRIKNDTTPLGTFRIKHKSKWKPCMATNMDVMPWSFTATFYSIQ